MQQDDTALVAAQERAARLEDTSEAVRSIGGIDATVRALAST